MDPPTTTLIIESSDKDRKIRIEFGSEVGVIAPKVKSALMDLPGSGQSHLYYSGGDGVNFCASVLPPPA
ncbi:hypothetical protein M408DRAFT_332484 [Serendipita vermifera MAFF 305830]|uniref:Uncharacterized protein n=1 Tax=Serendipita vermifera MAFF 305830 TaxID=933852 RepID=A0A0C3AVD0_SERVB|nr:hypothetical protein M408DRAFT_332484 [Serendipita vermifera MAFF 305830]